MLQRNIKNGIFLALEKFTMRNQQTELCWSINSKHFTVNGNGDNGAEQDLDQHDHSWTSYSIAR